MYNAGRRLENEGHVLDIVAAVLLLGDGNVAGDTDGDGLALYVSRKYHERGGERIGSARAEESLSRSRVGRRELTEELKA